MTQPKPKRRFRWWVFALLGLFLLLPLIFVAAAVYFSSPPTIMEEALLGLISDDEVRVSDEEEWLIFQPEGEQPTQGFIFYPGGRVDLRAYAPALRGIAREGYLVVGTQMPLNLAIFNTDAAADVIAAFPNIESWTVGGHSLGGSAAAIFADENLAQQPKLDGLVLWASYSPESNDLSDTDLEVTSIFGTHDGLTTVSDIEAGYPFLPDDTLYLPIRGGNHAQFGWYGEQNGDDVALIPRPNQQLVLIEYTVEALERVGSAE